MSNISKANGVVAVRLKNIIKEKGLKQSVIAEKAGYTPQEMNDMLNGRRLIKVTDIESIINAVQEFGVDANYLFDIQKE